MSRFVGLGIIAMFIVGCEGAVMPSPSPSQPPPPPPEGRPPAPPVNGIQVVGFTDSYHLPPDEPLLLELFPELDFNRPQITDQLEVNHARVIDLTWYPGPNTPGLFTVYSRSLRTNSHCPATVFCIDDIEFVQRWNPDMGPTFVLMRSVVQWVPGDGEEWLPYASHVTYIDLFEDTVDATTHGHIYTPNDLKGEHASVRAAIEADGWPSFDDLRGKIVFILIADEEVRDAYRRQFNFEEEMDGLGAFIAADDPNDPDSIFFTLPADQPEQIRQVTQAGFMVHTRVTPEEYPAAAAAGAHLFTTFEISDLDLPTLPVSCNPVTGPVNCEPAAFEPPAMILVEPPLD